MYTQSAPSKKGKVLSIPGLIKFVATGGANQNIWQARTRGGKVVRSALCRLQQPEGPYQLEDHILGAAALLTNDPHARKAESPQGVRHLLVLTRGSCTDTAAKLGKLWRWLDFKNVTPCAIVLSDPVTNPTPEIAPSRYCPFETFVNLDSNLAQIARAVFLEKPVVGDHIAPSDFTEEGDDTGWRDRDSTTSFFYRN
eukprot:Skav204118  [mRNA]  locus=scaffold5190:201889:203100:- [translate_table: standard]